jgi:hypothetical protein
LLFLPLGLLQSTLLVLLVLLIEHDAERPKSRTIRTITINNGTPRGVASERTKGDRGTARRATCNGRLAR